MLPVFFAKDLNDKEIMLDEETSKHITGVLRMQLNQQLILTNGVGEKVTARIIDDHRKKCKVLVEAREQFSSSSKKSVIAISLLKNASRLEWFLEKATELGVTEIVPLICERTEKQSFRFERMNQILLSAMLQSQQYWLPILHQPTKFKEAIAIEVDEKFIAHCIPGEKKNFAEELRGTKQTVPSSSSMILIGPEGDFSNPEIEQAMEAGFIPVSLGETRLRTETAGMVAAALLCQL